MEGKLNPSSEDRASANALKELGNNAFVLNKTDSCRAAVLFYTQAIALDGTNHSTFSNRSGAFLKLNNIDRPLKMHERVFG